MSCIEAFIEYQKPPIITMGGFKYTADIHCNYAVSEISLNANSYLNTEMSLQDFLVDINVSKYTRKPIIEASMVCDISSGIPLYAEDGLLITYEGLPLYVFKTELTDYE